jgi:hypothetical protein
MSKAGSFTKMNLYATNTSNGALSNYTITWLADIPMSNGDSLHLKFPTSMNTPVEPVCTKIKCIQEITCSAEKGTIIAVLTIGDSSCLRTKANYTFMV